MIGSYMTAAPGVIMRQLQANRDTKVHPLGMLVAHGWKLQTVHLQKPYTQVLHHIFHHTAALAVNDTGMSVVIYHTLYYTNLYI